MAAAVERSQKHAILVVDDDPGVLHVLEHQVSNAGYEVVATSSTSEAIRLAQEREFAVVLADQQMPEMTGSKLLKEISRHLPHASRVLLTGVPSLEVVSQAVNEGEIYRFVTKPWVGAEILATLRNAVQRYELVRCNAELERQSRELTEKLADANRTLTEQVAELKRQKVQLDESREALRANFERSLELCRRILGTFNPVLAAQSSAAASFCKTLAETEYFNEEEKHVLVVSSWLYDIGLTGVAHDRIQDIQRGSEDLEPELQILVENHTIYGQTLASFVDSLRSVGETIRAHHERFDGKGYPDGLAGEMIPWTARCLAVVVYYVTCGKPPEDASQDILDMSGTAFDPNAVRLFLRSSHVKPPPRNVKEVLLDELKPGMQLASGVTSPAGILLLPEGHTLDEITISKIRAHNYLTPLPQQLLIYG